MKTKTTLKSLLPAWNHYGDESLIKFAPETEGDLEFFNLGKYVSDDELEKEYESRGLEPAHPLQIAEYVKEDPDFKEKYIGTHWKDGDGKWCYAAFGRWDDGRGVGVNRRGFDWLDYWWYSGVRKSALGTKELEGSLEPSNLELRVRVTKLEQTLEAMRKALSV